MCEYTLLYYAAIGHITIMIISILIIKLHKRHVVRALIQVNLMLIIYCKNSIALLKYSWLWAKRYTCVLIKELQSSDYQVVLIYDKADIAFHPGVLIHRNQMNGITGDLTISLDYVRQRSTPINKSFDLLNHVNLTKIYPINVLCSEVDNKCRVQNGTLVYFDDSNHIKPEVLRMLFGDLLRQALHL
jgi:hypothetical protein